MDRNIKIIEAPEPVGSGEATKYMIGRAFQTIINMVLLSPLANPSVPIGLFFFSAVVGVAYIAFSGPVHQKKMSNAGWDWENNIVRTLHIDASSYTTSGLVFSFEHLLVRTLGSVWLLVYCISSCRPR